MGRFTGVLGLVLMLAVAWLFSTNRKAIRWRVVAVGVALQILFAIFVTRVLWGQLAIAKAGEGAKRLLACSFAGSRFVFGEAGAQNSNLGFIFAFQVLPAIIFIAAFFAILYYFGVMQILIRMVAVVMEKTMGASGAESLNVAASIVMGQTEAPLTIRPFLPRLTQSELMVVMTAGMAHVSGSIMAAYIATGVAPGCGDYDRARNSHRGQNAGAGNRSSRDRLWSHIAARRTRRQCLGSGRQRHQ
jgi:CNT family concentrative nucleoside transporter